LVVTEDLDVVMRECAGLTNRPGVVVGCQRSGLAMVNGTDTVRLVKIVRYTDWLPSPLTFEIAGDQLCHTVADAQSLPAACHAENGGMIEAATLEPGVQMFVRRP
jgi:hypothetical protein